MSNRGEVLVAIINNRADFALAMDKHWYRVPVSSQEKWLKDRWPPKWLALYQTKKLGLEPFAINYYAGIRSIRQAFRWQLFPDKPHDEKSNRLYYQLLLAPLQKWPRPIYSFYVFEPPTEGGETQWGRAQELRLHHRLLRPDSLPPGEDPVPPATWVRSISATFTKLETYQERPDLYSENGGLDGKLLPERWRAKDARYATYFLFHCEDTDYLVGGESNFGVIEDLTKQAGDPGKFLLYLWDDICDLHSKTSPSGVTRTCLSRVKALYR